MKFIFLLLFLATFIQASEKQDPLLNDLRKMFRQSDYLRIENSTYGKGFNIYFPVVGNYSLEPKLRPCISSTKKFFVERVKELPYRDVYYYFISEDNLQKIILDPQYKDCWDKINARSKLLETDICFQQYFDLASIPEEVSELANTWWSAIQKYNQQSTGSFKATVDMDDLLAMSSQYLDEKPESYCSVSRDDCGKSPFGRDFLVQSDGSIIFKDYVSPLKGPRSVPGLPYLFAGGESWIGRAFQLRKELDGWTVKPMLYKKRREGIDPVYSPEGILRGEDLVLQKLKELNLNSHPRFELKVAEQKDKKRTFHERGPMDFFDFITQSKNINDKQMLIIFNDLIEILVTLKNLGILHLDIKPENFIVYKEIDQNGDTIYRLKLSDFSYAILSSDLKKTKGHLVGVERYTDPSVIMKNGSEIYNEKSDIWSMGVVLYALFHRNYPIEIEGENLELFLKSVGEIIVARKPHPLNTLIQGMLQRYPENRFTIEQILEETQRLNLKFNPNKAPVGDK